MATNRYPHLDPTLIAVINGPQSMRESHIYQDRFIRHPRAEYILRRLEHLFRFPRRIRMPCLVIGGDSGMGKTTLLRRFQTRHPEFASAKSTIKPVIYVQTPSKATIQAMQEELVIALGGPAMDVKPSRMRRVIRDLLAELRTAMVLFDEVQHAARMKKRCDRIPLMDWFKELSTNAQIPVVCAGITGVRQLIKDDPQLHSRFSYVELSAWDADTRLAAFLRTYERTLPLKRPSNLASKDMMKAILKAATSNTDQIVQCLSMAAITAIRSGEERITRDLLGSWNDPPLLEEETSNSASVAAGTTSTAKDAKAMKSNAKAAKAVKVQDADEVQS